MSGGSRLSECEAAAAPEPPADRSDAISPHKLNGGWSSSKSWDRNACPRLCRGSGTSGSAAQIAHFVTHRTHRPLPP